MFYNPDMALDRDLGVAVVRALRRRGKGPRTGWEMTAATGVRGLRVVAEAGPFSSFTLTETRGEALRVLAANAAPFPGVRVLGWDARSAPEGGPFDLVDLDPYGSPAPFVGAALASVSEGGTLAVTATDTMVLAGPQPDVCRRVYGASPVAGRLGPEGGLRILLAYLERQARSRGRRLWPRVSLTHDHHVRTYVTVLTSGSEPSPVGTIDRPDWTGPPLGGRGPWGPLWVGPLWDRALVEELEVPPTAACGEGLAALLGRFREEAQVDVPFYYEPNTLAKSLHLARPPPLNDLVDGLTTRGYRASRTHVRPTGLRTEAPRSTVEEVARSLDLALSPRMPESGRSGARPAGPR